MILITQQIFEEGGALRVISSNSTYHVLMKSPRYVRNLCFENIGWVGGL